MKCWHAKTDGWAASTFHSNCEGKGPTVTIIQVGSYIFGGYTDLSWFSSKYHFISRADFFQFVSVLMVTACFAIRVYYILIPLCSNPVQLAFTSDELTVQLPMKKIITLTLKFLFRSLRLEYSRVISKAKHKLSEKGIQKYVYVVV